MFDSKGYLPSNTDAKKFVQFSSINIISTVGRRKNPSADKSDVHRGSSIKVWYRRKVSVRYPKEQRYEGGNGGYGWFPRHFKTGIYATRLKRKQWLRRGDKSAGELHCRLSRSTSDSFSPVPVNGRYIQHGAYFRRFTKQIVEKYSGGNAASWLNGTRKTIPDIFFHDNTAM